MTCLEELSGIQIKPAVMSQNNPSQVRGIGKGMFIAAWIIGILLLTQFFDFWEKKRQNPNQSPVIIQSANGAQELVLQSNYQGHYLTTGLINGEEVDFLLDTGATTVAVPAELAERLQLPKLSRGYVQTANGAVEATRTYLKTLTIGPFELHNVEASILSSMTEEDEILLGMSALQRLSFTQRNGTLILSPNTHTTL